MFSLSYKDDAVWNECLLYNVDFNKFLFTGMHIFQGHFAVS